MEIAYPSRLLWWVHVDDCFYRDGNFSKEYCLVLTLNGLIARFKYSNSNYLRFLFCFSSMFLDSINSSSFSFSRIFLKASSFILFLLLISLIYFILFYFISADITCCFLKIILTFLFLVLFKQFFVLHFNLI